MNVVNIVNVDPAVASDCGHPPQAAYVLRDRGHRTTTFSPEVNKTVNIDVSELTGVRYKMLDDLADGIFCAYLANYFWYWGEERCWVVGDTTDGYVALPRCGLPNCQLTQDAADRSPQLRDGDRRPGSHLIGWIERCESNLFKGILTRFRCLHAIHRR